MFTHQTKLKEIINDNPHMVELFNDLGLDYCCGGGDSLGKVAKEKNLDLHRFIALLENKHESVKKIGSAKADSIAEFKQYSMEEMIDSLQMTHHHDERKLLKEIDDLLNKILLVHYQSHSEKLLPLHKLFGTLKTELEAHFAKEEKLLFPLMLENPNASPEVIAQVKVLEREHDVAGDVIKEMQNLTDNFTPPEDSCYTYQKTYQLLNTLVQDIFMHVYKENSILIPLFEKQANR